MISFHEMGNRERMYSFVGDDGANIHIAIERLYQWVQDHKFQLETWSTPLSPEMAKKFVLADLIRRDRVRSLTDEESREPIIYGKEKPGAVSKIDMYLLDGRHRYVRAVALGQPLILAHILEPKQWLKFQIYDIPDITQEQLRRMPVKSQ